MSTIGIMQPYLFPYLGYFQLIALSDTFVFFDTAQYIRRGWINRNNILLQGAAHRFTLPVVKAPQSTPILEIELSGGIVARTKIITTMKSAYSNAPQFDVVMPIIEEILNVSEPSLVVLLKRQFEIICSYMGIDTKLVWASSIDWPAYDQGPQERILSMVMELNGSRYVNPASGKDLYSKERFDESGVELSFHSMNPVIYEQGLNLHVPNLSIIDLMMWNTRDQLALLLNEFTTTT